MITAVQLNKATKFCRWFLISQHKLWRLWLISKSRTVFSFKENNTDMSVGSFPVAQWMFILMKRETFFFYNICLVNSKISVKLFGSVVFTFSSYTTGTFSFVINIHEKTWYQTTSWILHLVTGYWSKKRRAFSSIFAFLAKINLTHKTYLNSRVNMVLIGEKGRQLGHWRPFNLMFFLKKGLICLASASYRL